MAISLRLAPSFSAQTKIATPRKDLRLWLGVALILGASLLGGKLFASASHRVPAVVAIHQLAAGSLISADDVQLMNVALPVGVESIGTITEVAGKYVAHDLVAGSLVNPLSISEQSDTSLRSVSIPIKAGHLPAISYGTSVDLWFTPSMDGAAVPGPAQLIASAVLVVAAPEIQDNSIDTSITLRLSDQLVSQVMSALRDGTLDIAVVSAS